MIFSHTATRKVCFFLLFFGVYTFLNAGIVYCSTFPFDEYAVFCSYFRMSGDKPTDQDIEELCFTFNRPTYTSFKPSEMFSKKSLLTEKNRVDKKIKSFSDDSVFLWKVTGNLSYKRDIDKYFSMNSLSRLLPQPTPYINSRITKNGQRQIKAAVSSLLKAHPEKIKKKDVEILITLKPEKSEYKLQKRNIVRQNVVLPIRYVIFQPTKVQILDELELIK